MSTAARHESDHDERQADEGKHGKGMRPEKISAVRIAVAVGHEPKTADDERGAEQGSDDTGRTFPP